MVKFFFVEMKLHWFSQREWLFQYINIRENKCVHFHDIIYTISPDKIKWKYAHCTHISYSIYISPLDISYFQIVIRQIKLKFNSILIKSIHTHAYANEVRGKGFWILKCQQLNGKCLATSLKSNAYMLFGNGNDVETDRWKTYRMEKRKSKEWKAYKLQSHWENIFLRVSFSFAVHSFSWHWSGRMTFLSVPGFVVKHHWNQYVLIRGVYFQMERFDVKHTKAYK